jgi:hypothetical protein
MDVKATILIESVRHLASLVTASGATSRRPSTARGHDRSFPSSAVSCLLRQGLASRAGPCARIKAARADRAHCGARARTPTRRGRDRVCENAAGKSLAHATSSPSMTSDRTPGRHARASVIQRTRSEQPGAGNEQACGNRQPTLLSSSSPFVHWQTVEQFRFCAFQKNDRCRDVFAQ